MHIRKCKVGMIVKSEYNDSVDYTIKKVNKESIDIVSNQLTKTTYLGQNPEFFSEVKC